MCANFSSTNPTKAFFFSTQVTKPFGSASGLSKPFKPPSFVQKPQKVAPPELGPELELEVNPPEEMDFNYDIPDIVEDDEENPDEVFRECKFQFNFMIKSKVRQPSFSLSGNFA